MHPINISSLRASSKSSFLTFPPPIFGLTSLLSLHHPNMHVHAVRPVIVASAPYHSNMDPFGPQFDIFNLNNQAYVGTIFNSLSFPFGKYLFCV